MNHITGLETWRSQRCSSTPPRQEWKAKTSKLGWWKYGPGVWENDREGAIRVLQAFCQPKTPPPCFKYILLYIPGRGILHDIDTLHLLHPRCCDRSLRGRGWHGRIKLRHTTTQMSSVNFGLFSISSWSNAWGQSRSKTNMKMDEHVPTMAGLFDMLNQEESELERHQLWPWKPQCFLDPAKGPQYENTVHRRCHQKSADSSMK